VPCTSQIVSLWRWRNVDFLLLIRVRGVPVNPPTAKDQESDGSYHDHKGSDMKPGCWIKAHNSEATILASTLAGAHAAFFARFTAAHRFLDAAAIRARPSLLI
jgi:hypothetical protein